MSKHQVIHRVASRSYEFYLTGEIGNPSNYVEWYDIIRNAAEEDTIIIHINSRGGQCYTALQLMRAIGDTQAHIITSIEGQCCSAATFIFLAGDTFEIAPHSVFLVHNFTGGIWGEGHKIVAQANFDNAWFDKLARDVYRDFLSDAEITQALSGQDIWLTSEQVIERCVQLQETRIADHKEQEC